MNVRNRLGDQGFTLVEVTIALTISGAIIGTIIMFMMSSLTNFATATTRGYLQDQAQLGLDVINNDIRLAGSADSRNRWQDNNAPSAPGDLLSWTGGANTLILATAAENSNGAILFSDPSQYVSHKNNTIYYANDGVVYKRVLANSVAGNKARTSCPQASASSACPGDRPVFENVTNFAVRYLDGLNNQVVPEDARSVEVSVTLQERKYGRDITVSQTTRTVFRND